MTIGSGSTTGDCVDGTDDAPEILHVSMLDIVVDVILLVSCWALDSAAVVAKGSFESGFILIEGRSARCQSSNWTSMQSESSPNRSMRSASNENTTSITRCLLKRKYEKRVHLSRPLSRNYQLTIDAREDATATQIAESLVDIDADSIETLRMCLLGSKAEYSKLQILTSLLCRLGRG